MMEQKQYELAAQVLREVQKVILGKREIVEKVLMAVLAQGHVLLDDVPGVGKTTLARLLCGLAKEQSGSVCIAGRVLSRRQRRRQTYFVMQNTDAQLFGDSVIEELRLNDRTLNDLQGDALLDLYGLLPWKTAHPATLSGGQKQRLTLAVSDLIEAPLLILDEPTSGLDFANMQRISRHLRALAARGRTLLVITHDLEFAAMTTSEVLHLRDDGAEQFPMQNNLARLQACLLNQK